MLLYSYRRRMITSFAKAMLVLGISCFTLPDGKAESEIDQTVLFEGGTGGYHTYRIPSIIQAKNGTLLAFCEGRKKSRSDSGDIDLLLRRSEDGGETWSDATVIWDEAKNTCGNPCPVVDSKTGAISLLLTWNSGKIGERTIKPGFGKDSRQVFLMRSEDHGLHWSKPQNITKETKDPTWTWYATGPGAGIQIQHGKFKGRLVVPCDHKVPVEKGSDAIKYCSHAIFSDDGGKTWQRGNATPSDGVNECEIVELEGGTLMLNMRNYIPSSKTRQTAISTDGGATWHDQKFAPTLIEPICQASIRRHSWGEDGGKGVILFSNPASSKRENLTVRASFDDAKTWPVKKVLCPGSSAYSCLVVTTDGVIGCLYEKDDYKTIVLDRFSLDALKK